ncbi:hypothetical protein FDECE_14055 [Fusarium decemcellulare]|nr:hypothetical protein FDECE_14055 [Fusarium decemcellulare]
MKAAVFALAACASGASAFLPKRLFGPLKIFAQTANGNGEFQQLIDHENPRLGTFSQQFWWNDEHYKGPGFPVVLFTPGEAAAAPYTGYMTNQSIMGAFAQAIGAAVVMVEHRYWGSSSPYATLDTKNLQHLTLKNAIADLTNFAKTVRLPFDPTGSSRPDRAPWVLSGGSYSGALSAWTEATAPGTFWAYHASSAPVQAIGDFWQYFDPIQQGMPQNCSKDVSLVVDHIDETLIHGTSQQKSALKDRFGLAALEHDADFASALENALWSWQSNSFSTGYSEFYQFCDAVEGTTNQSRKNASVPDSEGVGLEKALAGFANWVRTQMIPGFCASSFPDYYSDRDDVQCFNTYNASSPLFTDQSVNNNVNRQWYWMLCNEPFLWWPDGAPSSLPSIVSRLVNKPYWQRQCELFFPTQGNYTYGLASGRTVKEVNDFTGGWSDRDRTRLIWINGQFDPWRSSGVSSNFRPDGPLQSTPEQPVQVIPSGIHCSDLLLENGVLNSGAQTVIDDEINQIKEWVGEYYESTSMQR